MSNEKKIQKKPNLVVVVLAVMLIASLSLLSLMMLQMQYPQNTVEETVRHDTYLVPVNMSDGTIFLANNTYWLLKGTSLYQNSNSTYLIELFKKGLP